MKTLFHLKWTSAVAGLLVAFGVQASPVNVNTADMQTIADALPGIGPAKAQAIVDYRTQHGPFKVKEDLANVPGIGAATLEKIKGDVLLQESGTKSAPAAKK
ncbi:MAG TPA: helix-hairpin-helix domain-containing protein [Candidatus Macondimonas sp.]|jgi:competence protein ComEA|nr:helix-hairpin-helix domain-containing protein [Candidatus Macondimonas sp.]